MTGAILVVEDEPSDTVLMQRAFQKAGVVNPVHVLKDGREAIDYFEGAGRFANREEFPLPCLMLLDLKLPYVRGLDVLKWIRQHPEVGMIVLVLSSSAEQKDVAGAYLLGANGFLVKPSEFHRLVDMVRAIKDFWLTHNTPPPGISSPTSGVQSRAAVFG
ncbi:Response regulator receiver protein [Verrucomicrobia bacterium]|nr:Response regulator receiver protein [Verrucomicrobiota bacterium]